MAQGLEAIIIAAGDRAETSRDLLCLSYDPNAYRVLALELVTESTIHAIKTNMYC